jgi:hypothetical protein
MLYPDDSYTWCLERPYLGNKPFVSSIAYGTYLVIPNSTGKHRYFEVKDVPNRTHIEFHGANRVEDLLGCIAPCMSISKGIAYDCKTALDKLVKWHSNEQGVKQAFILEIVKYNSFKHGKWK